MTSGSSGNRKYGIHSKAFEYFAWLGFVDLIRGAIKN